MCEFASTNSRLEKVVCADDLRSRRSQELYSVAQYSATIVLTYLATAIEFLVLAAAVSEGTLMRTLKNEPL